MDVCDQGCWMGERCARLRVDVEMTNTLLSFRLASVSCKNEDCRSTKTQKERVVESRPSNGIAPAGSPILSRATPNYGNFLRRVARSWNAPAPAREEVFASARVWTFGQPRLQVVAIASQAVPSRAQQNDRLSRSPIGRMSSSAGFTFCRSAELSVLLRATVAA